ncbi:MAG: ABC transporter permease subunit [Eggerthellaceae bacterium]|jgi:ABC-type nitrate/sulfonate/bicarbonate transport system permease component|nr:ABC transporter permease subunit [Eggerthellaceae bacterium]
MSQKAPYRRSADERALARAVAAAPPDAALVPVPGMRGRQRLRVALQVAAGLGIGLLIWEAFALVLNGSGSPLGFPYPVETFERLGEYLFAGRSLYGHSIYEHLLASIQHLLVAFALAALVGIVLGSVLGYFGRLYPIGMVPVSIYQMIPGLAWLPVAILMFGLGDDSAVFIIFAVSSMVITIGVSSGMRMVPPVLVRAAKMMGAGSATIFCRVLVPQAGASIVNALRLGMSSAWRVLIAAEMIVGTGVGLGYSIQLTRDLLDYVGAFACITIICLVGLFIDHVVLAWVERTMRQRLGLEEA